MARVGTRRAAFWGAVGLVAIGANFLLEVAADRFPHLGLQKFTHYTHKGA